MVGYRVLDDFQQLLLRVCGSDGKTVQELDHQTGESLEGTGNAHGGANFDENAFGRVDVYLELSGFIDGRIEEGEEALLFPVMSIPVRNSTGSIRVSDLMSDIRTCITDISVHFSHHTDMLVTVEE